MLLLLPELTLLMIGLALFVISLGKPSELFLKKAVVSFGALVVVAALISFHQEGYLFYNSYKIDLYSQFFKLIIALASLAVLLITQPLPSIDKNSKTEYYLFLFMSLLGLMILVSSVELIAIFVALELSSFAIYIMVPMRSGGRAKKVQSEAGIKYLLFGVMASGFLLFGMSYLFGLTGSTYLAQISQKLPYLFHQPVTVISMLMVISGFFYKLAIFPFHFWVPDIYEGAANETAAFIASVPKIAAVALLTRLIAMVDVDGQTMITILLICSLASMFYGNLAALVQKDLKRMLGYSGIAHAGFVLFGLLTFQATGYTNAVYYIAGYVVTNLACFLVLCSVAGDGKNLLIQDLKGLSQRSPLLALTLLISMFSLAGIPPFVGFTSKFVILVGALKSDQRLVIPVILAVINTAIAIYYYLSVVRLAYCTDDKQPTPIPATKPATLLAILLVAVIFYLGVLPSSFLEFASSIIEKIL